MKQRTPAALREETARARNGAEIERPLLRFALSVSGQDLDSEQKSTFRQSLQGPSFGRDRRV